MTIPIRERLIGQRREVWINLKQGTYISWLLEEQRKPFLRQRVSIFVSRLRGGRSLLWSSSTPPQITMVPEALHCREQRLWAAVLIRAMYDYVLFYKQPNPDNIANVNRSHGAQANAWFRDKTRAVGSFVWVCDVLGIGPPESLYQRITTLTRRDFPRQCASQPKKSKKA